MHGLIVIKYVLVIVNTVLELGWSAVVIYDARRGHKMKRRRIVAAYIGIVTGAALLIFLALHRPS